MDEKDPHQPQHVAGFLDSGQEMLKNQQLATNLIYSFCDETVLQLQNPFKNVSNAFDSAGNENMAIQFIQYLLPCIEVLNKTQAFINNASFVDATSLNTAQDVLDLGVLVSLNTLKAQKENSNSSKTTLKPPPTSTLSSGGVSDDNCCQKSLLDSVIMGMWANPDPNHRNNSRAKELVFKTSSKDIQCYVKSSLQPVYGAYREILNHKTSLTTSPEPQPQLPIDPLTLVSVEEVPTIEDFESVFQKQTQPRQQETQPNLETGTVPSLQEVLEEVSPVLNEFNDNNILSQNVQVESQQPEVELPDISLDDFDAESMVNDFTDFLVDTQQGRRTSVVSKYQKRECG